jgi:hypothetical protein
VFDEEVGDIEAFAVAGEVEGIGELGLGPAAGSKEFFDHAVESGVNGFMEQREIFAGALHNADGFARFQPGLEREQLAGLNILDTLSKVVRQFSMAGHRR